MRNMSEKDALLYQISVLDFVTVDFAEYLDTHPNDKRALEYFTHYNMLKAKANEEFAAKYYPLNLASAVKCSDSFQWANAPLPWEN